MRISTYILVLFMWSAVNTQAQTPKTSLEIILKPEVFAAQAQPNLYLRKNKAIGSLYFTNTTIALRATYSLPNPRWQIKSGLAYNNLFYELNNQLHPLEVAALISTMFIPGARNMYRTDTYLVQIAQVDMHYISLPAIINYNLTAQQNKRLQFHVYGGLKFYGKIASSAAIKYGDSATLTPAIQQEVNKFFTQNISPFLVSADAGLGFKLRIYKNLGYIGEFTLADIHFIAPDNRIMNRPVGFAISGGIYYNFPTSHKP